MRIPTKFPTIIGLVLVITIIGVIVGVEKMLRAPTGASGTHEPSNVHITNVSDTAFTVSWVTQLPSKGTVLVSTLGKSNQIYFDGRDTTGKIGSYTSHSIAVSNARPNTDYTVKLMSNGSQYLTGGKPYSVRTPDNLSANTNSLEPAYGTILTTDGQPASGALVYITLDGGQELSTFTKSSGLWLIPLNQVRTQDLTSFLPTVERMNESIKVYFDGLETTAAADTLNDSPVPEMTAGKSYDFRKLQAKISGNNPLALRPTSAPNTLPVGGAVLGDTATKTYSVTLSTPGSGAALTTTLPLIQGTGVPNKFIGISIGITQPVSASVRVAPSGIWSFTPTKPLAPGRQSVTISSIDAAGKPVAITHMFDILKSGTQVLGDATPSATLAPTIAPISTESATPADGATSTLSGEPPPTSGNELPTILLLLLGIGLLAGGAVALR